MNDDRHDDREELLERATAALRDAPVPPGPPAHVVERTITRLAGGHDKRLLPDHPALLQSFVWQQLDMAPDYPMLRRFLDFWTRHIEGKLHSVKVAQMPLISPGRMRHAQVSLSLH